MFSTLKMSCGFTEVISFMSTRKQEPYLRQFLKKINKTGRAILEDLFY
jgi:hypothetical protein